jgi:hypothetical protein
MDDERAFLKGTRVDRRQTRLEAPPDRYLQGFVSAAAGQAGAPEKQATGCRGPQSGAAQNALRLGLRWVQRAPPAAPRPTTQPGDLVARALAILAEEHEAWQTRRLVNRAPRSVR